MSLDLDFEKNNVPPVRSRCWKTLTLPLLAFIGEDDRNIAEIVAWGTERRHSGSLTRHMLAWLSYNDLVYYVAPCTVWRIGSEPAGVADTWDKLDRKSSKSRRSLDPIPQVAYPQTEEENK